MTKKIVEVTNLTVTFGNTVVLKDITFSVNEKDILAILGPNGAGKSTLFKAMLGLIPFQGTVHWHTKKIGYLPPQESLLRENLPPLTVLDFFYLKNEPKENITQIFNAIGLDQSLFDQMLMSLSTGQFQRVMLAWVLIDNPSILLLDEPMSGIDVAGEETIYSLLHRIWKERDLTILLITHDVSIVWKYAAQILCLNKKLMCHGSPEESLTPEILKKLYGTEVSLYEHHHSF